MSRKVKVLYILWSGPNRYLSKLREILGAKYSIDVHFQVFEECRGANYEFICEDFDVVYFTNLFEPLRDFTWLLRLRHNKIILGVHAPVMLRHISPLYRPKHYSWSFLSCARLLMERFIKNIKAVHTLNTFDAMIFKSLGYPIVRYIPWGIDVDELSMIKTIKPSNQKAPFTIIFSGARYDKGGDFACRIFRALLSQYHDIHIIVTLGRGDYRYEIAEEFFRLQKIYPGRLEIEEWLPHEDFLARLTQSHVLLFPSRTETFGLVALEALRLGVPVVSFDIPGVPRDIIKPFSTEKIGYLAKPFDHIDLLKGCILYYKIAQNHPALMLDIRKRCMRLSSSFTIERMADNLYKLIRDALNEREP
jgi:glycosyltransferase involved in cell wall biosynthesis